MTLLDGCLRRPQPSRPRRGAARTVLTRARAAAAAAAELSKLRFLSLFLGLTVSLLAVALAALLFLLLHSLLTVRSPNPKP